MIDMVTKMIRNIHPVGQGGFVSEYFPETDKTFVYDCGTATDIGKQGSKKKFIDSSITTKEIECVYISHFDEDHVSLIPILATERRIKRVVIPYASPATLNLINGLFDSTELASIFTNPTQVFGDDTQINHVLELNDTELAMRESRNIDSIQNDDIESGVDLKIPNEDWEYIPFNVGSDTRRKHFVALCKSSIYSIDIDKLSEMDYVKRNLHKLKVIYHQIQGGINQNSLIVYSGPLQNNVWAFSTDYNTSTIFYDYRDHKASCLFTGDYDCSHFDKITRMLLDNRLQKIGTLEIPHHGAKRNWNEKLLFKNCHCFYTQCGARNSYGHPATTVLNSIFRSFPFRRIYIVNEFSATQATQCIVADI